MAPLDGPALQAPRLAAPRATAFEPDLFNAPPYLRLHPPGLRVEWPGQAVFQAGRLQDGTIRSPGRAPYGGFDVADGLDDEAFAAFVQTVETQARTEGATTLEVGLPPLCYAAHHVRRLPVLCRLGYRVIRQELNQALPLTVPNFAVQASYAARKTLNKARRLGIAIRRLDPPDHPAAYAVILGNRRKKGRALSMRYEDVAAMVDAVPDRMHVFGAEQEGRLLAAAITVAVNRRVLYVYAWGEGPGDERPSPVTCLAAHLHAYARTNGFALLDLGTSSVQGIVDPGLAAFKRSLGASSSLKLWLGRTLP